MKLKKAELLLFLGILIAALIWWFIMWKNHDEKDYGSIQITANGTLIGTYSLGDDQKIPIGDTNTCQIKDGIARMIEADCPDHLCIKMPAIDEKGGMIVCLPNQVIIEGIPVQTDNVLVPDSVTG